MALFVVAFEFRKTEPSRSSLPEFLASQEGVQVTGTTWMLKSQYSPTELRDRILEHIDDRDGVLVVETTGKWTSSKLIHTPGSLE